jgi:hypothetical protein
LPWRTVTAALAPGRVARTKGSKAVRTAAKTAIEKAAADTDLDPEITKLKPLAGLAWSIFLKF